MDAKQQLPDQPLQIALAVGIAVIAVGGLAWLWTGEWRWLVSAVVAAVVIAVAGTVIKPPAG
jgi:hypothetical protein